MAPLFGKSGAVRADIRHMHLYGDAGGRLIGPTPGAADGAKVIFIILKEADCAPESRRPYQG
jgi:hypothetical protein